MTRIATSASRVSVNGKNSPNKLWILILDKPQILGATYRTEKPTAQSVGTSTAFNLESIMSLIPMSNIRKNAPFFAPGDEERYWANNMRREFGHWFWESQAENCVKFSLNPCFPTVFCAINGVFSRMWSEWLQRKMNLGLLYPLFPWRSIEKAICAVIGIV